MATFQCVQGPGPNYKWIVLSNTTIGLLLATINSSILLIALPDIFGGIHINPLAPGNTNYLLWMILSFLIVTAVLVVSLGRLGDMFGRVRMYISASPCSRRSRSSCSSRRSRRSRSRSSPVWWQRVRHGCGAGSTTTVRNRKRRSGPSPRRRSRGPGRR